MKKILTYITVLAMAVSITACGDKISDEPLLSETPLVSESTVTALSETSEPEPEPVILEATHVGGFTISGDRLTAQGGAYDQDGNLDNGAEPIEWIVIADTEDRLLLLSSKVLDQRVFNDDYNATSWESSSLRKWLNEDFFNAAFNDEEKTIIEEYVTVPGDVSAGTQNITDKVFLLSRDEAETYIGAQEGTPGNRLCAPVTKRAINAGVWYITEEYYSLFGFKDKGFSDEMIGCGNWWLRSNGKDDTRIMDVGASGIIRLTGHEAASKQDGIRPAIYIRIAGGNN